MAIRLSSESLVKKFKEFSYIVAEINKKNAEFLYIVFQTAAEFKTLAQNKLFHSLIGCFHKSGQHSFEGYKELRDNYKEIAGLIEYEYRNDLDQDTKEMLWAAIKLLPIRDSQMQIVIELLKGKVRIEKSWSSVKKKEATLAIQSLINDMIKAGVNSKEFQEIMNDLENCG